MLKLLIYITLLLVSCQKDNSVPPYVPGPDPFALECEDILPDSLINWKTPVRDDSLRGIANILETYGNTLIAFVTEDNGRFLNIDLASGKLNWVSQGNNALYFPADTYSLFPNSEVLNVLTAKFIQKLDMNTGKEVQKIYTPVESTKKPWYFHFRASIKNQELFMGYGSDQFSDSVMWLIRYNLNSNSFTKVTNLERNHQFGYQVGQSLPAFIRIRRGENVPYLNNARFWLKATSTPHAAFCTRLISTPAKRAGV